VEAGGRAELTARLATDAAGSADCVLAARGRSWRTRWIWREHDGGPHRVVTVVDLTEDLAREDALRERAYQDSLTQVCNRERFLERLGEALERGGDTQVGVVYLDLDGFKQVNDTRGHAFGDRALQAVVARLLRHLRSGDVLGRVGGDEFAVLCLSTRDEAMSVVTRIRAALADRIQIGQQTIQLSASVGVALAQPGEEGESVLDRADRAMYAAKRAGRGRAPDQLVQGPAPAAPFVPPRARLSPDGAHAPRAGR
jgi:diguanylate cyclase (GGDEF)-like protein